MAIRRVGDVLPAALVFVALFAGWEIYVRVSGISPMTLPGPVRIVRQGFEFRDILWRHTVPTFKETAAGFGVSLAAAWLVATVLDFSAWSRRVLYPLMVASQTIPIIAIAPLFVIWFGFGLLPKIIVVVLVTFFPLAVNLAEGFASADGDAMRLLRSMGAGRVRCFVTVRVPSALPYFFAGLRVSIAYAVVGAVFAEYVGAQFGLGIYMQQQKSAFRTDLVLAAVGITSLLSIALFFATYLVQRLVMPWQRALRRMSRS
ncbi:Nitrate ABC transporter permease [Frankia canadensis]|uniref:Nitrate ABC transporter permease n=1 Tax=Frankia canadensis TaxID=1836972 RepID=A0A2I2KSN7_9ACTN|nr:Nitrate ABC transporter permease [Frankia canadensis]SOU55974.1 Nitrate ABC transporter permease [Frankia canadensis]